jgi:hypothetical protein
MMQERRKETAPPRRRYEWLFRIIVPLGALCLTLLLAELMLRIPALAVRTDLDPTLLNDQLVYLPNQVARHRLGGEIDTEIRINSRGFKDVEPPSDRMAPRGVALGDSFTEGWGVALDDTWVKQLERRLIDGRSGYAGVYNAGHNGTNPKNAAAVYERYFQDDPGVRFVLLGFCLVNDIVRQTTSPTLQVNPPTLYRQIKYEIGNHSILYNLLRRRVRYNEHLARLLAKAGYGNPFAFQVDLQNNERNRGRWAYTADFLSGFGKSVQTTGRDFVLLLFPGKVQVMDDQYQALLQLAGARAEEIDRFGFRDYLVARMRENGIKVLDLTPVLRDGHGRDPHALYFRGDTHWTVAGHTVVAQAIEQFLRTNLETAAGPRFETNADLIAQGTATR